MNILSEKGDWNPEYDTKIKVLHDLLVNTHATDKVLVFTQFVDTVRYLDQHLRGLGFTDHVGITGDTENPTELAWRFSPVSNGKRSRISEQD